MRFTKITIIRTNIPEKNNVNRELQWFGASLGLFGLRDKDKSCFRIFIILLKAVKQNNRLTSDELAVLSGLTRGTVVHHLNNLMDKGIVSMQRNTYFLRMDNLEEMVDKMKQDADSAWKRLDEVAKDIDKKLGLK